jgi:hypothetical protein
LPLTCAFASGMSHVPVLAVSCSWLVIATELALAVGYAVRARATAALGVAFHCALFVLTGSTFGAFFYAAVASGLLVVDLERQPAPFDRAWPYFGLAVVLTGPWVRPWFAFPLALLPLALSVWRRRD